MVVVNLRVKANSNITSGAEIVSGLPLPADTSANTVCAISNVGNSITIGPSGTMSNGASAGTISSGTTFFICGNYIAS